LPPYIKREANPLIDSERYQTVYASKPGATAAPTAGLHFTPELLNSLENKGVRQVKVTLHTGMGTFKPVDADDIRNHQMHTEPFIITQDAAEQLNHRIPGKKEICVGTTCCRVLESSTNEKGIVKSGEYTTNIFIYPGYSFKYVKTLLTNFHLPGSTLLMLVSALAGHELMQEAYAKAIEKRFRFFSYGDAMLIL
jgi:S-adenosylmethionine:tRNA ribosyltransferase-isomerase